MNLKKKVNIPLILVLGAGVILVLVFAGILALRESLTISRVQASPGSTCKVSDDLEVTGAFDLTNNARCTYKEGTWTTTADSLVKSISCDAGQIATGGGCVCDEDGNPDEVKIRSSIPTDSPVNGWECLCDRTLGGGTIVLKAYVVCCF